MKSLLVCALLFMVVSVSSQKQVQKKRWGIMPNLTEAEARDRYMSKSRFVLNIVHQELTEEDTKLDELILHVQKYAYEVKYSLDSDGKANSPIKFSRQTYAENETGKTQKLQFIKNGIVLNTQEIDNNTRLQDVKAFLRNCYFDDVFTKISDNNQDDVPEEFKEHAFNVVFYGHSNNRNAQAIAQWVIKRHQDVLIKDFGFFYLEKPFKNLEENQMGLYRTQENSFVQCQKKKLGANSVEAWV